MQNTNHLLILSSRSKAGSTQIYRPPRSYRLTGRQEVIGFGGRPQEVIGFGDLWGPSFEEVIDLL